MSVVIIGICGKARSGKDTAAGALTLYRNCHRIALADGIREAMASLSGSTGSLLKELTPDHNYRRALQTLGTEARDTVNAPGLWVHLALAKIHYAAHIHPVPRLRFVIPDVRYRHEEAMIRHQVNRWHGRFGVLKLTRGVPDIEESDHSSETQIVHVPCHRAYANDGTVSDLADVALKFFDDTKGGIDP